MGLDEEELPVAGPDRRLDHCKEDPRLISLTRREEQGRADGTGNGSSGVMLDNCDIIKVLDNSEGKAMGLVASVTKFNGDLYIGSLAANFVGKRSLAQLGSKGQAGE
uniref:Uncharacterized protein n=1 Tax=Oryza meridionalis TaxID=40149 RepID=A0A0E0EAX0_9ORYZ